MSFTVIIPARLKSSRLPDKPLADICGRPMIVRVAERALSCGADRVVVAVDDASVYEACAAAGLDVIMTDPHHPTGTDRLAEAVAKIGLAEDVTAAVLERKRIEHERDHDILTGLYNRQAFNRVCTELFAAPERMGVAALMMMDLDNLKHINDLSLIHI